MDDHHFIYITKNENQNYATPEFASCHSYKCPCTLAFKDDGKMPNFYEKKVQQWTLKKLEWKDGGKKIRMLMIF